MNRAVSAPTDAYRSELLAAIGLDRSYLSGAQNIPVRQAEPELHRDLCDQPRVLDPLRSLPPNPESLKTETSQPGDARPVQAVRRARPLDTLKHPFPMKGCQPFPRDATVDPKLWSYMLHAGRAKATNPTDNLSIHTSPHVATSIPLENRTEA